MVRFFSETFYLDVRKTLLNNYFLIQSVQTTFNIPIMFAKL